MQNIPIKSEQFLGHFCSFVLSLHSFQFFIIYAVIDFSLLFTYFPLDAVLGQFFITAKGMLCGPITVKYYKCNRVIDRKKYLTNYVHIQVLTNECVFHVTGC